MPAVTKSELPTSLRAVEGSQLSIAFFRRPAARPLRSPIGGRFLPAAFAQGKRPASLCVPNQVGENAPFDAGLCQSARSVEPAAPLVPGDRLPRQGADVAIISPEREISLRPTDEVTIEFAARDDFGVVRAELVAFVGDQPDLQNALVLPPQTANETKNSKTVSAPKAVTATKDRAAGTNATAAETKASAAETGREGRRPTERRHSAAKEASQSPTAANRPTPPTEARTTAKPTRRVARPPLPRRPLPRRLRRPPLPRRRSPDNRDADSAGRPNGREERAGQN